VSRKLSGNERLGNIVNNCQVAKEAVSEWQASARLGLAA
jgi:hypothetical protein